MGKDYDVRDYVSYSWICDFTLESGVEIWRPVMEDMEEIPAIEYEKPRD
jgi:hypothetical protein